MKKGNLKISAILILILTLLISSTLLISLSLFVSVAMSSNTSNKNNEIVFHIVSDTQEPMWIESLGLYRNNNAEATDMIYDDLYRRSKTAVFHLGDIVAIGFNDSEWDKVDAFVERLKSKNIKFYPTLGNHDLFLSDSRGYQNFRKRYPYASKTGYARVIGNTAFLLLNSNFGEMTAAEINKQQKWYKSKMQELEKDNSIDHIIVGTHYSPFTNSRISKPSQKVADYFIPAYLATPKAKLFVSGHAHIFEHFKFEGKDFLVIGGGGGLIQPTYKGSKRKYNNLYNKFQMFHYLECTSTSDNINIKVRMIKKDFSKFIVVYRLKLD